MMRIHIVLWSLAAILVAGCGKNDAGSDKASGFDALLEQALANIAQGVPRAADEAARAAVAQDPSSAEARLVEGQSAYLLRDYARARTSFAAVAEEADLPRELRSQAYAALAVVELAEEKVDCARLSLFRAVRLNFRNAAAWYHLGLLSRSTYHFYAAAKDQFDMACRLDPNSDRTRSTLRTTIPALRDQLAQQAAAKPGAAKRDPARAAKLLAEGYAAQKKKDDKKAADRFEQAAKADPLSWEAAWNLAKTLPEAEKGKSPVATVKRVLEAYENALDAKPSSRETCLSAARFALQNRRPAAACQFLSHALAHFYDSKPVVDLYIEALEKQGTTESRNAARLYRAYRKEL